MTHAATAKAEIARAATRLLGGAISLLNALFLASFVLVLGTAMAAAQTCAGSDLRPVLEAETPDLWARMLEEARATPNGDAKLWRITSPEGATSHLYGTMHVSDPEIVALGEEASRAYAGARTIVIETTDVLDPQKMAAALWSRPGLMSFTDGGSLLDFLDDEEERLLDEALAERGMTLSAMRTIKPWILSGQLATPACMAAENQDGFLDLDLARDAIAEGREVLGLETAAEQLEAMASMPMEDHIAALVETARVGDAMDDVFATMGQLYKEGRIGTVWPFLRAATMRMSPGMDPAEGAAANAAFEEAMITRRNRTMAERVEPILIEGDVFFAVGALHLPGEEGLVTLLRERGFEVEAVAP